MMNSTKVKQEYFVQERQRKKTKSESIMKIGKPQQAMKGRIGKLLFFDWHILRYIVSLRVMRETLKEERSIYLHNN